MVNFGFPSSGGSQSRVCCRRDFELITTLFTIFRSGPWSHNIYLPGIWFLSDASPKSILMAEPLPQQNDDLYFEWDLLGSSINCTQSKLLFCILKRTFITEFDNKHGSLVLPWPLKYWRNYICHLFYYHLSRYFYSTPSTEGVESTRGNSVCLCVCLSVCP